MSLNNHSNKLVFTKRIVGRDDEVEVLRDFYSSFRDNHNFSISQKRKQGGLRSSSMKHCPERSIYIKGHSGIGKSALVTNALEEMVRNDGGYFCHGKFDIVRSHRPFSAIVDAIDTLCSQVIAGCQTDPEREQLRVRIRHRFSNHTNKTMLNSLTCLLPNLAQFFKVVGRVDESALLTSQEFHSFLDEDSSSSSSSRSSSSEERSTPAVSSRNNTIFVNLKSALRDLVQELVQEQIFVMFLDDLQWANNIESFDLLEHLVSKLYPTTHFLLVGGFRSDEICSGHYLAHQLAEFPPSVVLEIVELKQTDVGLFLAETLKLTQPVVQPLTEHVYGVTKGNIFFVKQYLEYLQHNSHVYWDIKNLRWEWENLSQVHIGSSSYYAGESGAGGGVGDDESVSSHTIDMRTVVSDKILRMPPKTIDALKLASCIGGRFDLTLIDGLAQHWWARSGSSRLEQSKLRPAATPKDDRENYSSNNIEPIEEVLWHSVEEGLIEETNPDPFSLESSVQYKFTHDKVQSASYDLIGGEKGYFHHTIGEYLVKQYQSAARDKKSEASWMLVMAGDHLYRGKSCLATQNKKDKAAELISLAAIQLEETASFESAALYLRHAISLLEHSGWQRQYYLCLKIHTFSAEMEYCSGNQHECNRRVKEVQHHAQSLQDKETAIGVWMSSLSSLRRHDEALQTGYILLRKMKFMWLPARVNDMHVMMEYILVLKAIRRQDDMTLLNKPEATDHLVDKYVRTLIQTVMFAWFADARVEKIFLSLRALRVSLQYGYTSHTGTSFALAGLVAGSRGSYQEARRLGEIAMRLQERFDCTEANIMTRYIYYTTLHHLHEACGDLTNRLMQIRNVGLDTGDVAVACITAGTIVIYAYHEGQVRLDRLASQAAYYRDEQISYNKTTMMMVTRVYRQLILNMVRRSSPNPEKLEGDEIKDFSEFMKKTGNDKLTQRHIVTVSMQLAYHFDDLDRAKTFAVQNHKFWKKDHPTRHSLFMPFYRGLIWCQLHEREIGTRTCYKKRAKEELKIIRGWVNHGLAFLKMFQLFLEAEIMALVDNKAVDGLRADFERIYIKEAYDNAISEARSFRYNHIAALAHERAGTYFARGDSELATDYLNKAVDGYQNWKAWGKIEHLRQKFPQLITERGEAISSQLSGSTESI